MNPSLSKKIETLPDGAWKVWKIDRHGANAAWLRLQVLTHILKAVASPQE